MAWFGHKLRGKFEPPVGQPLPSPWNPPMVTSEFCGWADPNPTITLAADGSELRAVPGTQAPNRRPWDAMLTRDRIPMRGEYDERDPKISQWRAEKMLEAKMGVRCIQVDWSHQHAVKAPDYLLPLPNDNPLLMSHCADNHPLTSPLKFCLSFWDVMTGGEGLEYFTAQRRDRRWTDADLETSMAKFATSVAQYMLRPNYWLINDRPVLYRGWAHTLAFYQEQFGFNVTADRILAIWREEIKTIVGAEPYLVATSMDPAQNKNLKAWGFDALTQYLLHGKGWDDTMGVYRGYWQRDLATCRAQGLGYIVPATSGYKGEAWNTGEWQNGFTHVCTAEQFKTHLIEARTLARDNHDVCIAVGEYAWSEFGEGGAEEPLQDLPGMLHRGDEMIRAHALACAA